MKPTPILDILWLFIATRLLLLFITYIMYILLTAQNYTSTPVDIVALLTSWHHWDAVNYTRIAQYGYQSVFDLAFFPLFPFLIACISHVLGDWSSLLVGTILSNAALLGALWVIYQLLLFQYPQTDRRNGENLPPLPEPPSIHNANRKISKRSVGKELALSGVGIRKKMFLVGARLCPRPFSRSRNFGRGQSLAPTVIKYLPLKEEFAPLPDDTIARRTILYLCIFPTAFFFFAAYNESLYLLLAAGTFLAIERERWWLAGLLGLLAALTRSIGILLVIPYLYELWRRREHTLVRIPTRRGQASPLRLLPCLLIPLGTGIYALYCWHTFGNPLAFAAVQSHWGRQTTWPWMGILHELGALFWNNPQPFGSANQATMILNLSATCGFIFLISAGWRTLPKSYSLWMSVCLLFILTSPALIKPDVLLSNQRFVLELFPAFITLARLTEKRPRIHYACILTFATLLAILSTGFIMNRWIV